MRRPLLEVLDDTDPEEEERGEGGVFGEGFRTNRGGDVEGERDLLGMGGRETAWSVDPSSRSARYTAT